jgi:AcrR family transcriptional regulator
LINALGDHDGTEAQTGAADPLAQNLLVRAALEARLARSAHRLDAGARVERLKAATLFECAEKGYANLAIADIARRAKVSTATIYADYKDRDALLVAAIELLFEIVSGDVIEVPQTDDPMEQVEMLLRAHGYVYSEALITWFFRLHVHLAWSGHDHLHKSGERVFKGIDAFWTDYLGHLVAAGWLVPLDFEVAIPLLLGPMERCTIISRLGCGDDETGRPKVIDVARHTAQSLFAVWGGPAWKERNHADANASGQQVVPPTPFDVVLDPGNLRPLPSAVNPNVLLDDALAAVADTQTFEQRKHRILLAAAVECHERGYNAASMIEVAARSRNAMATLYNHFDDKVSLFASALVDALERQGGFEAFDATHLPQHERTAAAVFAIAARLSDPHNLWMHTLAMASEISGTDRIVAVMRGYRDTIEAFLLEQLGPAVLGVSDPSEDLALTINFLLGGVERAGLLSLILFGNSAVDLDKLAKLSSQAVQVLVQLGQITLSRA